MRAATVHTRVGLTSSVLLIYRPRTDVSRGCHLGHFGSYTLTINIARYSHRLQALSHVALKHFKQTLNRADTLETCVDDLIS